MQQSQQSVREGADHWVHPLTGDNKRSCNECGGDMGHYGELRFTGSPGSGNRSADLECIKCGHRLRGVILRGF